jgi:O-antigen/teichoic acid export membrane protein
VSNTGEPAPAEDLALADGHSLARGAAANTLVLLAANFRGVFTFLIARVLGEAALGRFGIAFAVTDLLSKPGMLGLDSGIVPLVAQRQAAGDQRGVYRLFRSAVARALIMSAALAALAIPFIDWLARVRGLDAFSGGESIMLLALPAIAVARISTGASRAMLAMRNEFYSRGIAETWTTIAVFLLALAIGLRHTAPALAVVGGTAAGAIVAFVLARGAIRRAIGRAPQTGAGEKPDFGRILRFSTKITGSDLLSVLMMQADVLLLGLYVGRAPGVTVEAFGVFCAAAEVAGGMRKVRQVFDPIFAPVVATRAVSQHRGALKETVAGPGRWVLSAQLPLVGALLLASGSVMSIYGGAFRQGALWLAILGLAHGANSFAGLVETLLMIERPGLNLMNASITVAVQVISGLVLIPILGVTGAALSMCIGFTTQGVLRFIEVRHVFGWSWPWAALKRPLAAFALAFAPAAAIRVALPAHWDFVAGAAFLALYAGAWAVLGAEPADRAVWRQLTSRTRRLDSVEPLT